MPVPGSRSWVHGSCTDEPKTSGLFGVKLAEPETERLALFISTEGAEVVEWRLEDEAGRRLEMVVFTAGDSTRRGRVLRLQRTRRRAGRSRTSFADAKDIVLIDHAEISTPSRPSESARTTSAITDATRTADAPECGAGLTAEQRTVADGVDLQPVRPGETAADPSMRGSPWMA